MNSNDQLVGAADKYWGYEFGVDGLMNFNDVSEFLGKMSRSSVARLVKARLIRKGRMSVGGWPKYCRRSVTNYAKSLEV